MAMRHRLEVLLAEGLVNLQVDLLDAADFPVDARRRAPPGQALLQVIPAGVDPPVGVAELEQVGRARRGLVELLDRHRQLLRVLEQVPPVGSPPEVPIDALAQIQHPVIHPLAEVGQRVRDVQRQDLVELPVDLVDAEDRAIDGGRRAPPGQGLFQVVPAAVDPEVRPADLRRGEPVVQALVELIDGLRQLLRILEQVPPSGAPAQVRLDVLVQVPNLLRHPMHEAVQVRPGHTPRRGDRLAHGRRGDAQDAAESQDRPAPRSSLHRCLHMR